MRIDYALTQYLHRYGNLPLPGMGQLLQSTDSARLSFPDRKIFQPVKKISFSSIQVPDKHLIDWLSAEFEIENEMASALLKEWVTDLLHRIKNGSSLIWHGIGRISSAANEGGEILFENIDGASNLQYSIAAEKVIRSGNTHTVLVGETEKSSTEMEQVLQPKKQKTKKYWPVVVAMLLIFGVASLWLIGVKYPEAWSRKGNNSQISVKESPSRNKWIP
jgi:hypothetical protein